MNQYFLKFTNESTALAALQAVGLERGAAAMSNPLISVDIIGDLVEPAVYSDDGLELVPPILLEGFHVNLLCETLPPELAAYSIEPRHPLRVFAI